MLFALIAGVEGLISWVLAIFLTLSITLVTILHEFGHALACRILNVPYYLQISITKISVIYGAKSESNSLIISAAGPAANAIFMIISVYILIISGDILIKTLAIFSFFMHTVAFMMILPIFSDGKNVINALLYLRKGE
jgi:hypothetical protein